MIFGHQGVSYEDEKRSLEDITTGETGIGPPLCVKRLVLFGSYARELQREESDVDTLVEDDPSIGLGFVDLAKRLERALGIRAGVVSRRTIEPRYWEEIKEDLFDVT